MVSRRRRELGSCFLLAAAVAAGCAGTAKRSQTPATLEAARKVRYFIAPTVTVDGAGIAPNGTSDQLRYWVGQYMQQVGLPPVQGPARPHDVEVRLSLSARGGSMLLYGTAGMLLISDGRTLDQLITGDHVEPAGNFARAVGRDLVELLVHSTRLAAHADAATGGRTGPEVPAAGVVIPAVAMSPAAPPRPPATPGPATSEGTPAPAPPPSGEASTAAARAHTRQGAALYDLNRYHEAYNEFEQAYLLEQDPALLYNMGQCQRKLGNNEEALHFYRTYLRRAPNAPSSVEAEKRVRELEDAIARGRGH